MIIDILGAGFVLLLTALAFPIIRHYIIVWIDNRRAFMLQTPSIDRPAETEPKSARLICPECKVGKLIEDKTGGICAKCGVEFSPLQLNRLRQPTGPQSPKKPNGTEYKKVEIILDDVKIGWLETTFQPVGNAMKRGSIDAYYFPNPSVPKEDRFIGYFDDWDTAHAAVEKAYFTTQQH